MKIAWILLLSLVIVFMIQESDAWRRRRSRRWVRSPRIRVRSPVRRLIRVRLPVRRVIRVRLPVRRVIRVRKIVHRVGRVFRKIGRVLGKAVKIVAKGVVLTNPKMYIAKMVFDKYKEYKMMKEQIRQYNMENPDYPQEEPTCVKQQLCGGLSNGGPFKWFCGDICKLMDDQDELQWPGEAASVPCEFSEYDNGNGYFGTADLAYQLGVKYSAPDNIMVFKKLDINGDGKVTKQEFENKKGILLSEQGPCAKETKQEFWNEKGILLSEQGPC